MNKPAEHDDAFPASSTRRRVTREEAIDAAARAWLAIEHLIPDDPTPEEPNITGGRSRSAHTASTAEGHQDGPI